MLLKALFISVVMFWSASVSAEGIPGFMEVDTTTYGLYKRQQWQELIDAGNRYIGYGYDYYYLRMRIGVAHYKRENFIMAVTHFTKALGFNEGDTTALTYLYYAYLELNRSDAADRILGTLPEVNAKRLRSGKSGPLDLVYLETGPIISSGKSVNSNLNLDGKDDLYGEINLIRDSYYNGLGVVARVNPLIRLQVSYMNLFQGRTAQVMTGDSLILNKDHSLQQNQVYVSPSFRFGKGFSVIPAFHYLDITFNRIYSYYDQETKSFMFDEDTIRQHDYLASLCLIKDISLIRISLTGTYAKLNEFNHYQGEFALTYYPQGNLDLYSVTVLRYIHGRADHFLFAETAGLKIMKGWWLEASATFGQAAEFFEKNGYIVYNLPEDLLFKWGVQTYYQINDRFLVSLKYENLYRESLFLQYIYDAEVTGQYYPENKPFTFHQHLVVASLTWNL